MTDNTITINNIFNNYPDIMDIKTMQEALSIGRNTAYNLINTGAIKNFNIGNSKKIPKQYIIDYIINLCYNNNCNELTAVNMKEVN